MYEEAAYIAYHFHWPRDAILEMEHAERHRWISEISKINQRLTDGEGGGGGDGRIEIPLF